ncbi:carbon-nitrogen hydrolase family protein [Candidatus Nitrosacidococcus tergens]|uniref:Amidohydrolase n=1 Tax=Candidatus Nitrosacidococcus tergens TaxID=553981 RepID=A0A7G1Q9M7_9GAMM|nr:carbon-nitrogen hydrolase family protein [Candidatus Nitrosacidococcus tergens]CAB1276087.1 Amidohydrolase [Candidatus Nitrosacidococcus tergens]
MKSYEYRAAAVQTLAKMGDVEANLEICAHYVKQAAQQNIRVIVFPECMNVGYLYDSQPHARQIAETIKDGKFIHGLAKLARQYDVYIASGLSEWDPQAEKIFNTGILLDRKGELVVHYHKQFLTTHDQNWFKFGERGFPVVETELGRVGMMICFDGRIPEIPRCTALKGAQVILDMANFFLIDQAELWRPARALENGVWICAATKAGQERSIYYPGGSMIVDPRGEVKAKVAWDIHGMAISNIDPTLADDKHYALTADKFTDRRPDTYGILTKPYEQTPVSKTSVEPIIPSQMTFNMAAAQTHVCESHPTTLDRVIEQVTHGARFGIKVMVLPEYVASPNWRIDEAEARRLAGMNQELLQKFAEVCKTEKCALLVPNVEEVDSKLYPTSFLIGLEGEIIMSYRKVHLFSDEQQWGTAGSEYPVVNTSYGRMGIMMGYDGLFPEAARCLGVNGADVILWPTRMQDKKERKYLLVPRAADNRCAVILANRVDAPYGGGSMVALPAQFPVWDVDKIAPNYPDMHKIVLEVVEIASARQKNMMANVHMFAKRQPWTYGALTAQHKVVSVAGK